jgi:flagellar biosynthetic protein FlhB
VAEDTGQERTEQATPKRRDEARKRGQVARSMEVNSALMLLAGFGVLMIFRKHFTGRLMASTREILSRGYTYNLDFTGVQHLFLALIQDFFILILPLLAIMFIAGILVNLLQVGFLLTGEPISPKLNKINPAEGLKRIFSKRTLESLVRDIVKIGIVGWIGYSAVKSILEPTIQIADASVQQIFSYTGMTIFGIAMKILLGYAVIAILDYAFQRWDHERSLMMTRQEIREELKQTEGDPLLRARIRSVQRELARRRMMEEVPKADAVITNPTEIAVAISYRPGMAAPVVVAKGRRAIAEKIRQKAVEAGIPIVQNVLLAQALYKAVEIGRSIPAELYTAVAEVLAYVYRLKGKKIV